MPIWLICGKSTATLPWPLGGKVIQGRVPSAKCKPLPVQPTGVNMCMKNGERYYARWLLKGHAPRRKPKALSRSRLFSRQLRQRVYTQKNGPPKRTVHFYFFLPNPNVGCQPAAEPFWLGAAAIVFIFSFFGFLDSRLPLDSPLPATLFCRIAVCIAVPASSAAS
jgi:hypothetical protein